MFVESGTIYLAITTLCVILTFIENIRHPWKTVILSLPNTKSHVRIGQFILTNSLNLAV